MKKLSVKSDFEMVQLRHEFRTYWVGNRLKRIQVSEKLTLQATDLF